MEKKEIELMIEALILNKAIEDKTLFKYSDIEDMDLIVFVNEDYVNKDKLKVIISWVEGFEYEETTGDNINEPLKNHYREIRCEYSFLLNANLEKLELFECFSAEIEDVIDVINFKSL